MSLPTPNLDDKTFEQLIDEAKKLIPIYAPEWTDHNLHDPGITFVELLAWLTESELYRTNLITDKQKLKYLGLLGSRFRPSPPRPAKVDLTIEANGNEPLEKGEVVSTKKQDRQIFFELAEDIKVAPIELKKVIVDEGTGVFDRTEANKNSDSFYPVFGLSVRKGCKLYLGFDQPTETFSFMCYLYEKDLIGPGKHGEEADYKFSNAKLKWQFCVSKDGDEWQEISTEDGIEDSKNNNRSLIDGTAGFKKSGRLLFEGIPKSSWEKSSAIPEWKGKEDEKYYWLCCEVIESHFEYPPRIETIRLNTVPAVHGKTIIDDIEERKGNGLPHQVFELRDKPILDKTMVLGVDAGEECLFDWDQVPGNDTDKLKSYLKEKFSAEWVDDINTETEKIDGDIGIEISNEKVFTEKKSILLRRDPEKPVVNLSTDDGRTYGLLVKKENDEIKLYDQLWKEVDDFDGSGPNDRHFLLDREKGEITLGDGLYGKVPPAESLIKVLQYRVGGGKDGNVQAGREWKTEKAPERKIANHKPASGGTEAETIEQGTARFLKDLKIAYQAVTSKDFESIAKNTPGLRVAKAKAVPNYHPAKNGKQGCVTVVVIPFTPLEILEVPPEPSDGLKNAVCRHLDRHRLLGTEICVVAPLYVKVDVSLTVVPLDGFKEEDLRSTIIRGLERFLHPIRGGENGDGWPIGRTVYRSEIFELVEKVEGVDCVWRLSLSGDQGSFLDPHGNLNLPSKTATVYAGRIAVTIERKAEICKKRGNGDGTD